MEMTRAGFRLGAIDFIFIVTMFSVIRNEYEVDRHSIGTSEETFWKLSGECLIDELLESLVYRQGFQDGSGDGSVIGTTDEVSAGGEERLDVTKGAKEDIDEDGVVAGGSVVLLVEQTGDGELEVLFDNLVSCAKIPSWRTHSFLLKKGVVFSHNSCNRKDLGLSIST
jgi:hypothetical protein